MRIEEQVTLLVRLVWLLLVLAACVHVFIVSRKDPRIGHPWRYAIMCFMVWPLSYLCWLFWWPGKLRQALFGSDKVRAEKWAQRRLNAAARKQRKSAS
jgi:transposase